MHKVIKIIVEAKSVKDALKKAEAAFSQLCNTGISYDWGGDFTEDSSIQRWGKKRPAVKLSSKEGIISILESIKIEFEQFKDTLEQIDKLRTEYTKEQLFDDTMFRYKMAIPYNDRFIYLENDTTDLQVINAIIKDNKKKWWVVPYDAHY